MYSNIEFNCRHCKRTISTIIRFSEPDFTAEKMSESYVNSEDYVVCPFCEEEHRIDINNGFYGLELEIDGVDSEDIKSTAPCDEYDWLFDEKINFLNVYKKSIAVVNSLLNLTLQDNELNDELLKMLYVRIITSVETYLADMIRSKILGNNENIRKFIENDPSFAKRKFQLNEIYNVSDQIFDIVKKQLSDIIYHDIKKVKPLCESVLKINFPKDIGFIFKAILIRHDLVHRNGKNKGGEDVTVTKEDVLELIQNVNTFIESIDGQVNNIISVNTMGDAFAG